MINPYYYLFYRFNQFLNKKGDNEWGVIYAMTVLPGWNILIFYIKILPITQGNFDGLYRTILIIIVMIFFILNSILFLNKKRVEKIVEQYGMESQASKMIGGWLIIFYILLSFGLIFI